MGMTLEAALLFAAMMGYLAILDVRTVFIIIVIIYTLRKGKRWVCSKKYDYNTVVLYLSDKFVKIAVGEK